MEECVLTALMGEATFCHPHIQLPGTDGCTLESSSLRRKYSARPSQSLLGRDPAPPFAPAPRVRPQRGGAARRVPILTAAGKVWTGRRRRAPESQQSPHRVPGSAVSPALAGRCSYGGPGMVQHLLWEDTESILSKEVLDRPITLIENLIGMLNQGFNQGLIRVIAIPWTMPGPPRTPTGQSRRNHAPGDPGGLWGGPAAVPMLPGSRNRGA
eukprot:gene23939-biopygen2869